MYFLKYAVAAVLPLVLGTNAVTQVWELGDLHWVRTLARQNNITVDKNKAPPTGYFVQYIDHANTQKGTFKQKYYYSDKYYKGPGSPIVFTTPGESSIIGSEFFFHEETVTARFAEAIGAGIVVLEHRYWGESIPFKSLNAETLQHLTLKNAIADFTYFARNVKLPFDKQGTSQSTKAPRVFSGGSYAGALSAWTEQIAPGTFWAYHASSAVVEAVYGMWYYWDLIQNSSLPRECRADVELGINHIDSILLHGTKKAQHALKQKFKLGGLKYNDDFAYFLATPLFYYQFGQNPRWCKNIAKGKAAAKKAGRPLVEGIIEGWANWSSGCVKCWNTHNPQYEKTIADKQWGWMLCNEPFAYWRPGEPRSQQGVVSKALTSGYYQNQCATYFPKKNGFTYGSNLGRTVKDVNAYTGGSDNRRPSKRLVWSNSGYDPWRGATISSPYKEGGPQVSTPEEPVFFTPKGYHVADYYGKNCKTKKTALCRNINAEVKLIKQWVSEFSVDPYPGV